MQRRLIVMRHADAVSGFEAQNDHARPLSHRGRTQGPAVALTLNELGWVPQRVVHSDAERACETWTTMAHHLIPSPQASANSALYLADPQRWVDILASQPDDVTCVMMLGHCPGIERITNEWTGVSARFGTSCAALLVVHAESWSTAASASGCWDLVRMVSPNHA